MFKIIKNLKLNYSIFKSIMSLSDKKIKVVFYSENKSYQMCNDSLVKFFANKYPNQVYYVISDIDDKYDDSKVNYLYIGKGFFMNFFFSILKA